MNISTDQLAEQVSRARARGWTTVMRKAEKRYKLPAALLLALALGHVTLGLLFLVARKWPIGARGISSPFRGPGTHWPTTH